MLDGDAANCLRGLGDFHRVTVGIECNQVITPVFQPFGDLLLVNVIPVDRQQRAEWGCFLQLDRGDVISVPGIIQRTDVEDRARQHVIGINKATGFFVFFGVA